MAGIVIREADQHEDVAIHGVLLAAFSPYRDQYTPGCFDATVLDPPRIRARMDEGPVFVAERSGKIVGTVGVKMDARGAYLRGLAVHPDASRNGVGRQLLQAAESWAKTQGATTIWLSTTLFLASSIGLYQATGYTDAPGPAALEGTPLRSFEKQLYTT